MFDRGVLKGCVIGSIVRVCDKEGVHRVYFSEC